MTAKFAHSCAFVEVRRGTGKHRRETLDSPLGTSAASGASNRGWDFTWGRSYL